MAVSPKDRAWRPQVQRARRLVAMAGVLVASGVAVAATRSQTLGGVLLCAGWLTFVAGLHLFGRTGTQPDR